MNMNSNAGEPTPNPEHYIHLFLELYQKGKECWINAGKTLAEAVDKVPGFMKLMEEHCPQFPPSFLNRMLDLGRGALHEELLLASSRKTAPPKQANLPYRIVQGKLVVMQPVTMNRKELAKLLSEME